MVIRMRYLIGTRGSKLALVQTNLVIEKLTQAYPKDEFLPVVIKTTGDIVNTIGELINVLEKGQEELQIRMGKRCFSEMIYSLEELGLFCESDFDKENNDIG